MTQLGPMFEASGSQEPFPGTLQSQERRGGSPGLPDVGEVLAQIPDGVCEQHLHLVRLLPTLGSDAQSAEIRGRSFSLLSWLHPGDQKTLSAQE